MPCGLVFAKFGMNSTLLGTEITHVRMRLARGGIGSQDPVDFFMSWATPEERYQPKYNCPENIAAV